VSYTTGKSAIVLIAAIFGYEQVNMHQKDAISATSNIVVIAHRPNYTTRMQRLQAHKYEPMPTGEQRRDICNFVFNKALTLQKECCEHGEKKLGLAWSGEYPPKRLSPRLDARVGAVGIPRL
jgi:hypothetical protein